MPSSNDLEAVNEITLDILRAQQHRFLDAFLGDANVLSVVADPLAPRDQFYIGQNPWFDEQGRPTPHRAMEKPTTPPPAPVAPLKTRRAISLDETP